MSDNQRKGGLARAKSLAPVERSEIARTAANERWSVHYALDEAAVDIAGMKFRCAVLDDEIRVISGTEFMRVMGIYRSGAISTRRSPDDEVHFPLFLAFKNLRPFIMEDAALVDALRNPIKYRELGKAVAEGIPGSVLRRVLNVWVRARAAGVLGPSQASNS